MSRRIQDIKPESIFFSKQKVNSSNKFLYVYSDKKPLVLKFPLTRLPFGLQKDNLSKKSQYILDLSMENSGETMESFKEFDEAIISKVHSEFFSEKTIEEVTAMYTSCMKYPDNPRYSPTLRTKIIIGDNNAPKCDFYESEKNDQGKYPKIDVVEKGNEEYLLQLLCKSSKIESIIECIGLWFFGNKFGLSFKVTQVLVHPAETLQEAGEEVDDCQFVDTDSNTSNSDADFLGE
jgi:hypothetical protein